MQNKHMHQKKAVLAPLVLLDEVEVVPSDNDSVPHLGGLDCASHDTTTDGHIASEGALLVHIGACNTTLPSTPE
jgi:hypothetical protein